jgi:hypothetical protein
MNWAKFSRVAIEQRLTRDAGRPATTAEVDAVIQAMRRANWGPYKEME